MDKSVASKYSIHDILEQENRLLMQHYFSVPSINDAVKSMRRRYAKHCGNTSWYMPHQGAKEKARRLRQMERGNV